MTRRLLTAGSVRDGTRLLGNAVLMDDEEIAAVGRAEDLASSGDVEHHEYPGATIVAGLRDAHIHPVGYAAALQRPSLKTAPDLAAVADIVSDAARRHPDGSAIVGLRLDDEGLAEGRLPDRHLLDAAAGDRPVLLFRYCGHVAVANSAALELAAIGHDTVDPAGGVIDRDDHGAPTGVLRETAIEPVTAAIGPLAPTLSPEEVRGGLLALASTGLAGLGAIAATDTGIWGGAESELDLLLEAAADGPLDVGIFVIAPDPASLEEATGRISSTGGRTRFLGVKMFSDGSFGGHTAAMHQPYADRDTTGTDRLDPAWAETMARRSLDLGGSVAIHAIGDRANSGVLDLMERLIESGADPASLRIEHASVLTAADIERFGELGITASVQPAFIASETEWLEKRMGPDRLRRTYPFRSLVDAGAPVAGGSDSPVEPPHPLLGMAAARDRHGIVPEESLTASEALQLFTSGAARATDADAALRVGSPATFTILSADPVEASPDELRATRIQGVWLTGRPIVIPAGITAWQD